MAGCVNEPPEYNLIGPTESDRVVLIEEFSGARCPNCPQGSQELENLKAIHGDNLVIVSIHAGDFAFPYPDSKYDFATEGGDQLLDLLGNPLGYPSAVVNREEQNGSYQVFSSRWASLVSEELEQPARLSIHTEVEYDTVSRVADMTVTILPFQDIPESLYLTVLVKEDDIVDPQADRAVSEGIVPEYVHKNVLRQIISEPYGDVLLEEINAFQPIVKNYSFTLPPEDGWWQDTHCKIVSFISFNSGALKVLQANEVPLIP